MYGLTQPLIRADQAAGLRHLLGQSGRVDSIACRSLQRLTIIQGQAESPVLPHVVLAAAHLCAQAGERVLLVDGASAGVSIASAAGRAIRYELLHLLEGDKPYAKVAASLAQNLELLPAARGLKSLLKTPNGIADWLQACCALQVVPQHIFIYLPTTGQGNNDVGLLAFLGSLADAIRRMRLETVLPAQIQLIQALDFSKAVRFHQELSQGPSWSRLIALQQQIDIQLEQWLLYGYNPLQSAGKTLETTRILRQIAEKLPQFELAPLESLCIIPYHLACSSFSEQTKLIFPASFARLFGKQQCAIADALRAILLS